MSLALEDMLTLMMVAKQEHRRSCQRELLLQWIAHVHSPMNHQPWRSPAGYVSDEAALRRRYERHLQSVTANEMMAQLRLPDVSVDADELWKQLAGDVADEASLREFFQRRQATFANGQSPLRIATATKVTNLAALRRFVSADGFDVNPLNSYDRRQDSLLFHGCPEASVANIISVGLSMGFARNGKLGQGLYGASDPRKSMIYTGMSHHGNGSFMLVCRFNLGRGADHATDSVFDEFCVYDESHVVVLWSLKLQ